MIDTDAVDQAFAVEPEDRGVDDLEHAVIFDTRAPQAR